MTDAIIVEMTEKAARPGGDLCVVMADEIASLRTRITALEAEVADLNECLTFAHMDGFEKGRAARAAMEGK